jgi:hypothetical protein
VLASITSVALLPAASAQADPQQDANFVQELSTYGFTPAALHRPNWQMVIYIADALCGDMMVPGVDPNEMVAKMHGSWPNLLSVTNRPLNPYAHQKAEATQLRPGVRRLPGDFRGCDRHAS